MKKRVGRRRKAAASRPSTTRPGPLYLRMLGGFELRHKDRPVSLPFSAERLVVFVALHGGSPNRSFVAGTLWPDTSDGRAAASLRSSLWRIKQTDPPVVEATATRLRLARDVVVDVHELKATIGQVLEGGAWLRRDEAARLLAPGELLPGWYEDWVLVERERLRQLRLNAMERLCERLTEGRHFDLAVEAGLAAVTEEPLRESAHRALIGAHLAQGNASEAIREYRHYRQLLNDELGVEPSPEMENLLQPLAVRR
jgi:DNA-binding SARP family transcriptional activator